MRIFRRKSRWEKLAGTVTHRGSAKSAQSGLLAAGAAVGVTALSSAVSSVRKKSQQSD
jgi:hypothetical protein